MNIEIYKIIKYCEKVGVRLIYKNNQMSYRLSNDFKDPHIISTIKKNRNEILKTLQPISEKSKSNDPMEIWRILYKILVEADFPDIELKNIFDDIPKNILLKYSRKYLSSMYYEYKKEIQFVSSDIHLNNMNKTMKTIQDILNSKEWDGNKGYRTMVYADWSQEELSTWSSEELRYIWVNCLAEMKRYPEDKDYRKKLMKIRRLVNNIHRKRRKK